MSLFLRLCDREMRCLAFLRTLPEGPGRRAVVRRLRKIQAEVEDAALLA